MRADVGVRDGLIHTLAPGLPAGVRDIDASGHLVLPGGIDSHCHVEQISSNGVMTADDFDSATVAAAFGGNTTIIPFAAQHRGMALPKVVSDYHACAGPKAVIDYSFHLIVSDPTPQALHHDLPDLIRKGYTSFKVFMTYDDMVLNDRQLLDVFDVARREKALVMVHCEGYDSIKFMTERLEAAGRTAPYYHGKSRPELVEREAAHRAISHAELVDVPIMIVHVSGRQAMEQIRWAQQRGLKVYGETCPQYISLTEEDMKGNNFDETGGKYVCSPPPRDRDGWEAIWEGLRTGVFQTFSSDHCPFVYDSAEGKLNPKGKQSFRYVPNGIPGVETRLPILFSEGVSKGRITLEQFVALTSTNHAKIYGLYPQKGSIAVGADADLVLWDANRTVTISQSLLHHGSDYTPWEGYEVKGWPVKTILRGDVVFDDGKVVGKPGSGRFLKRALSPYAVPNGTD
jgi:dihydropyrimidinase